MRILISQQAKINDCRVFKKWRSVDMKTLYGTLLPLIISCMSALLVHLAENLWSVSFRVSDRFTFSRSVSYNAIHT